MLLSCKATPVTHAGLKLKINRLTMKHSNVGGYVSFLLCLGIFSCVAQKDTRSKGDPIHNPTPSPIDLSGVRATFHADISYGAFPANTFDVFLPESDHATPVVIYIHGGGFTGGDKAKHYPRSEPLIRELLQNNVAFASINYRLLGKEGGEGILRSLKDCKRALQFIRFHATSLNIDKRNVILMGGSAGAGASLWIGLQDEMADSDNPDPVMKESTRVAGVVALLTQANYDILEWHNSIFQEYQKEGLDQAYVLRIAGSSEKLMRFYGFEPGTDVHSEHSRKRREELNMLNMMSSDDPEIYVENSGLPYSIPTRSGELTHHPLHAKALMDRAAEVRLKGVFHIPKMNIDTRKGEGIEDFILRLFGRS